jgi:hypothetical protein
MTPDSLQYDLDILRAMRKGAQALEIARDPLFSGAVAQLIGIIDGLIRVSVPPATGSGSDARPSSAADSP